MINFIQRLYSETPIQDRILIPIGTAVSSTSLLTQIQTIIGITVGVLTILVLIPRACAAWKSDKKKKKNK